MTWDSVIDDLGGTGKVASALGLEPPTVSVWRERGIPPKRWLAIVQLAEELGREGITFESLSTTDKAEARA
jgi:DNA-binding transcriptional regulator YdaS (Cro superfamily)